MKLTKYLFLGFAALALASCSSDDWNTASGVSVEMSQATITVKENAGTIYVPLKLTGEANGPVKVTVSVAEYSEFPAVDEVNYLLTSDTVTFPEDVDSVSLEFLIINDMDVNEDRAFIVTIKSVEGASIGTQNTTVVTVRDDDGLFYEAIQGQWSFKTFGYYDGDYITWTTNLRGVEDETDPDYEKYIEISGLEGYDWVSMAGEYSYDQDTNTISLYFPYGQIIATDVNFSGLGLCDVALFGVVDGYIVDEGGFNAVVDPSLKTITFDEGLDLVFYVVQGEDALGIWDRIMDPVMTR